MNEVRIGLAGVGYWGSKLARNIADGTGSRLAGICDPEPGRLSAVVDRYPGARGFTDLAEMLASDEIDAVVLATPASRHHEHATAALEAAKHVLVEKPLALNAADCRSIQLLAAERDLVAMVGHTFIYSEPVRMLRRLVVEGELGDLLYIYGQRLNLGVIRDDLNALWNFGPHDVSILLYLMGEAPVRVSARQYCLLDRHLEDVAFVNLEFANGAVGHIHLSWLDPRKVREYTVVGDGKMAVYDDTDVEAPIRIYDKGVTKKGAFGADFDPATPEGFGEFKLEVRAGDILIPRVQGREPLRVEIEHFAECVANGAQPITDAAHGLEVVAILEAAERSAAAGGAVVDLAVHERPAA
ncbi:MAG TPA: Gfo/Idh/MocA family oxidoreductase [Thermoleophilaceae bacterium]|nr:Gfo/Idh/MocA family oxidoreductase [Thermoleophilaceae bacterium]